MGGDVVSAMKDLGFENYASALSVYLSQYHNYEEGRSQKNLETREAGGDVLDPEIVSCERDVQLRGFIRVQNVDPFDPTVGEGGDRKGWVKSGGTVV